jgi:hypothetical protein
MKEKLIVFIILTIIFMDIYLLINKDTNIVKVKSINNNEKTKTLNMGLKVNDKFSYLDNNNSNSNSNNSNNKESYNEEENDNIVIRETVSPNMFGKPTDMIEGKYILWEFQRPSPWTKILYKYNEDYPFYFFIKMKIPSLNDYEIWKKIIANLNFDPKSGEVIIPTADEESALSIANLMITNFKGEIPIEEIIKKNLIDISITKARKFEVVKNKIREQIILSQNTKIKESFTEVKKTDFQEDLAKNDSLTAYEGGEFAFI